MRQRWDDGEHFQEVASKLHDLEVANHTSDDLLDKYKADPTSLDANEKALLEGYLNKAYYEVWIASDKEAADQFIETLFTVDNFLTDGEPRYAGDRQNMRDYAQRLKEDGYTGNLLHDAWHYVTYKRDVGPNEERFNNIIGWHNVSYKPQADMAAIGEPALMFLPGGIGAAVRLTETAVGRAIQ